MKTLRVKVSDEAAKRLGVEVANHGLWPQAACIEVLLADRLRLAQALRVIRDSGGLYSANVATAALDECGIADPPEEDHP